MTEAWTHWDTAGSGLREYALFPVSLITQTVQSQVGHGTTLVWATLLVQQDLVLRACAVGISSSLADSPEGGPSLTG